MDKFDYKLALGLVQSYSTPLPSRAQMVRMSNLIPEGPGFNPKSDSYFFSFPLFLILSCLQ